MKIKLLVVFVAAFAILAAPAFAKNISVGQFALKYAQSIGFQVTSAQDAITALAERGLIDRNAKADSMLTEKDLGDILGRAGIKSSTSYPAQGVDESVANAAISALTTPGSGDTSSNPNGSNGGDDDMNNNGKKTRPKGQMPNSRANPNAFYGREDEG